MLGLAPVIPTFFAPRRAYPIPPHWETWNQFLLRDDGWMSSVSSRLHTVAIVSVLAWLAWHWWPRSGVRRTGVMLWACGLSAAVPFLLSGLFGTVPWFPLGTVALPMMMCLVFWMPAPRLDWLAREVARICLAIVLGSLLIAIPTWGWIVEVPYNQGYIPWLDIRLHGLAVSQGALGLYAMLYLAIRLFMIRDHGLRSGLTIAAVLLAAFLTQSKFTWAASAAILGFAAGQHLLRQFGELNQQLRTMAALWAVAFAAVFLWAFGEQIGILSAGEERLTTLTGRTDIWQVCLDVWSKNPVFGYGNDLWSPSMASQYEDQLGWLPSHSHNQGLQSLAQTGLIGLITFLLYAMSFAMHGLRAGFSTGGCTVFLAGFLLFRCLTESWLGTSAINGMLFIHGAALALIYAGLAPDQESTAISAPT